LSELARYSQIDYDREMTFVALTPVEPGQAQRIVAEVRAACDPDNRQAEFAILVDAAWQGRGLGRALLEKMIVYLRTRGTSQLVGQCQAHNTPMVPLARALGFQVEDAQADDLVDLRLDLQSP
jgi:acetyltransferase